MVPYSDLIFPKQRRWKPKGKKDRKVYGYDIETIDGQIYLICDSEGRHCYPHGSIEELTRFLFKYSKRSRLNFTYNLRYDFQAIVKLLNPDEQRELWEKGKVQVGELTLSFIPKKLFVIRDKHRHSIRIYDIAQFYPGMSLNRAAQFYLKKRKARFDVKGLTPEKLNTERARQYCIRDAQLAAELAELVISKLKALGLKGPELISPAYISEQFFRQNCYIPQIDNIPEGAKRFAYNSYRGGWFEAFKRGYFPEAYEYDINSAYPDKIRNLIDVTKGEWRYVKGEPPKNAYYGYIRADIFIPPRKISPYMLRVGSVCKNPVGFFRGRILTLVERRAILRTCRASTVESIDGWYYFPKLIHYPFRRAVDALYRKRQQIKRTDPAMSNVIKLILNSLYGKFWQKVKKGDQWVAGNLFNPFYATEITSRTRMQIYKEALQMPEEIIAIATDSIISRKPLPIERTTELGAFSYVQEGSLINIMGGIRTMTIDGNEIKTRFRGFARGKVNFSDLLDQNREVKEISFDITKVITLGEVVAFDKQYTPMDLNRFKKITKTLDLNSDQKRVWEGEVTAGDLLLNSYDSEPLFFYER